ncbi:hypothetical protein Y032_0031g2311 [Ancylostoma ceylanicum]|uniref:Uncharacterized protein n=1 Tax=Ancylostoma ceylanicum TaxID=53326 RepID=A0A016UP53_9BILA|nr:hypothetical protein Y032_0031g2311 [Ancylostoma ceylanicum]
MKVVFSVGFVKIDHHFRSSPQCQTGGRAFGSRQKMGVANDALWIRALCASELKNKRNRQFLSFLKLNPSKVFFGIYAVSYVRMGLPGCHLLLARSVRIHGASLATPIFRRDPNATPPPNLGIQ